MSADPSPRRERADSAELAAPPATPTRAVIAVGANLGDSVATLKTAVAGLAANPGIEVTAVSGLWLTAAVGGPEQPDYTNAVVIVRTSLSPLALLGACHQLEQQAHRERTIRWGPRTLDIDVIDYHGIRSTAPELTLPHPRAHLRAFVLAPWVQVSPEDILLAEGTGRSVTEWLAGVGGQQIAALADRDWWR